MKEKQTSVEANINLFLSVWDCLDTFGTISLRTRVTRFWSWKLPVCLGTHWPLHTNIHIYIYIYVFRYNIHIYISYIQAYMYNVYIYIYTSTYSYYISLIKYSPSCTPSLPPSLALALALALSLSLSLCRGAH